MSGWIALFFLPALLPLLPLLPLLALPDGLLAQTLWWLPLAGLCLALAGLFREAAAADAGADVGTTLARLLGYLRPDGPFLLSGVAFIVLAVACDTSMAPLQGTLTDLLRGGAPGSDFYSAMGRLAAVSAGSCLFSGLRSGCFKISHARLNKRLQVALFRSLLNQEVAFFQENDSGSLSSRLHADVDRTGLTVALNANAVTRSSLKALLMLASMMRLSPPLAALACAETALLAALQRRQVVCDKECKEQRQDVLARLRKMCHQSTGGIRLVRGFAGRGDEIRRFQRELERLRDVNTRTARRQAVLVLLRKEPHVAQYQGDLCVLRRHAGHRGRHLQSLWLPGPLAPPPPRRRPGSRHAAWERGVQERLLRLPVGPGGTSGLEGLVPGAGGGQGDGPGGTVGRRQDFLRGAPQETLRTPARGHPVGRPAAALLPERLPAAQGGVGSPEPRPAARLFALQRGVRPGRPPMRPGTSARGRPEDRSPPPPGQAGGGRPRRLSRASRRARSRPWRCSGRWCADRGSSSWTRPPARWTSAPNAPCWRRWRAPASRS
ncbi:uncharacterized protein LOC144211785 isoform X4 [Stigmatopora nigra]